MTKSKHLAERRAREEVGIAMRPARQAFLEGLLDSFHGDRIMRLPNCDWARYHRTNTRHGGPFARACTSVYEKRVSTP